MDDVGKEMTQRIRQLCRIQFGHEIMQDWDKRDKEKKNYIIERVKDEFVPADEQVSNDWWIKSVMVSSMSHRKDKGSRSLHG